MESEHYDVERLDRVLDRKWESDARERSLEGRRNANLSDIRDGASVPMGDFFCSSCNSDFFCRTPVLIAESDWGRPGSEIAYFRAKHCGAWAKRWVTDRSRDPYFMLSPRIRRDRASHYQDLIQPHQSGYELLYGRKNQK